MSSSSAPDRGATRFGRLAATLVAASLILAACTGGASPSPTPGGPTAPPAASSGPTTAPIGDVTFLSTQLRPVEEAEKVRSQVLSGFGGKVDFIPEEEGPFQDRVKAEAAAGSGTVDVLGALHGDFVSLQNADALADLSDLAGRLQGVNAEYLGLGKLGTDKQYYIPWMQATYIMVADKQALPYLPPGADVNALTYEQLEAWGKAIKDATGQQKLGFPAGEKGLFHRFLQGHLTPAYTGGMVTGVGSPEATAMWTQLKGIWQYVHPQAPTYEFMQEPLLSGEVWIAWDHVARLIEALRQRPDDFVTFPVPAGPKGRGFMPVIAGLAIPKSAPNRAGAEALIEYLLRPEAQVTTLQQVAFFPVVAGADASSLEAGVKLEADAVAATLGASDALAALLPVGIGDKGGELNKAYRDAFTKIVLSGEAMDAAIAAQVAALQAVFDATGAACWPPDPPSSGACVVQ